MINIKRKANRLVKLAIKKGKLKNPFECEWYGKKYE
jgi:hypothetical protein